MRTAAAALAVCAVALAAASAAPAATVWLCKPGMAADPCTPGLSTTQISPGGEALRTFTPASHRRVDCFYVYPTVSDQQAAIADRTIDPEERSIALYQAARFSSTCRIFAPMYRQVTLRSLGAGGVTTALRDTGYRDVRAAWRDYLEHDNHGRGVVLVGHSQGTFVLRRLVAEEIDAKPAVRRRLVSAVLLGGNVVVKRGKDAGGDFRHVRACRAITQLGCVIAYSLFNATPPADSIFGRTPRKGMQVLCTNPAALAGGTAKLHSIVPTAPFAPGTTIGAVTQAVGYPPIQAKTTWAQLDGAYTAHCSTAGGAKVLRVSGTPKLNALPDATWGLHLADANLALGDLVRVVTRQAERWLARR